VPEDDRAKLSHSEVSRLGGIAASAKLTPEERRLRAQHAGLMAAATRDTRQYTKAGLAAARIARTERLENRVRDAALARGEELSDKEVKRRVAALRKAHMVRIALKSSRARSKRRQVAVNGEGSQ